MDNLSNKIEVTWKEWQKIQKRIKRLEKMIENFKKSIVTQGLVIVDKDGQIRAELYPEPDGRVVFTLCDREEGDPRVGIVVLPDGKSEFILLDKLYRIRVEISVFPDGKPSIKLYNAKGKIIYSIP